MNIEPIKLHRKDPIKSEEKTQVHKNVSATICVQSKIFF